MREINGSCLDELHVVLSSASYLSCAASKKVSISSLSFSPTAPLTPPSYHTLSIAQLDSKKEIKSVSFSSLLSNFPPLYPSTPPSVMTCMEKEPPPCRG